MLNNNQINACALIGQLDMVYCGAKLIEKSRVFCFIYINAIDHE